MPQNSFFNRKFILGFLIVTIFATLRIISYYHTFFKLDYYFVSDNAIYAMLSQRFLEGDIVHAFHPLWNSGFPLFTVPFYLITQSWEKAQILLSMTASVVMIYAMYFTLGRISLTLGIIAAYFTAFSIPLARLTLIDGWTEPLYILLLWTAVIFSWQIIQTQKLKYYVLAGIFFGLSYFTRTDTAYTILAFFLFLGLSLIFEKRKTVRINIFNPLTVLAVISMGLGYIWWILTSTKFLKTTTINYHPKATFIAFFIFLGVIAAFGLVFKIKDKMRLNRMVKEIFPKIMVLFLVFFLINLPYIAVISHNLGKLTISGKYGFIVSGHVFTPERDRLTTFAQDIWSLDYPNYQSPYYDSAKVYSQYLKNIDTAWEFFPKKFGTYLDFYNNNNIFSRFEVLLILVGIFAGLVQKKFFKLTVFLLILWFINLFGIVMFMDSGKRYLAFSYPFIIAFHAIAILGIAKFLRGMLNLDNIKQFSQFVAVLIVALLCLTYFKIYLNLNDFPRGGRADNKLMGDWIKSQDIKVIMARTEGIPFYSGAKLVYVPAAPPDIIVLFAKNWGVEYILSRPEESSWPYMKVMADPNFKHTDLKLIHSFDDGTLVWKVALTDEEKRYNYRTGKPISVFCRSSEWSRTDDPNLPACPDKSY